MEELTDSAKIAFASTFSFYLKSSNFHWNVEGRDFLQYHDLFGKIYNEVYASIDVFAEQIRGMGAYVPGSLARFTLLSEIDDETAVLDQATMVQELLADNEKLIGILKLVFKKSEENQEFGFSDFIAGRIDAHRKHGWQLRASTKEQQ